MKRITLLCTALLSFTLMSLAQAGTTHLGQSSYKHVTLEMTSDLASVCSNYKSFYRVLPTGSRSAKPYMVPSNTFLIITDVIWNVTPPPTNLIQGQSEIMQLIAYKTDGTPAGVMFRSTPVLTTSDHVSSGVIGGSDQILAGVRIGPWRTLCAHATSIRSTGGNTNTVTDAWVHGYEIAK